MSARHRPSSLRRASSRMVCTDSSRARSMNAQVLTITHSASSARSATANPAAPSRPSMSSESTWFLGQPSVVRWTFMGGGKVYRAGAGGGPPSAVASIGELQRDAQVALTQERHHLLQVVEALAGHADLVLLDRGLDLELGVLDEPHDLARLVDGDALLQGDRLTQHAAAARLHLAGGQGLERHAALVQPGLENVGHGLELHLVGRAQLDLGLLQEDLVLGALEVVPGLDLPACLIE